MPIHVCVTCDEPGCKAAQSAGFDGLGETYGDLVSALPSIGWSVDTDGNSRTARCQCPGHAASRHDSKPARPDATTPTTNIETAQPTTPP
jgi:hypothetical protein